MKKDRNRKSLNTRAFAAAAVLGVGAVAAASIAAYNRTMANLTPTVSGASTSTWTFSAPESSAPDAPASADKPGVARDDTSRPAATTTASPAEEAQAADTVEAEEVNKPIRSDARNIMPVEGEVSHPFSNGELVKSETLGVWKTHDGCDILCPLGTDVKSMSAGTVTELREDPLWGVVVIVEQDNGLTVEYCGLAKEVGVKTGQEIQEGAVIGKTADTCQVEISQEPHLHLGVKQGGKWIDPMSVISN